MADFTYPTSAELEVIEQDLMPRLTEDDPLFDMLPITTHDAHTLMWEQRDNYLGLQQVRGLNGEFPRVKKVGIKRYQLEPGVYGEFIPIDEAELTTRRQMGTFGTPIDLSDVVRPIQDQLLQRRLDRMRQIGWTLISTGTFSVPGPNGSVLHTDSYTLQTFAATVPWATAATATPLLDLRRVQLLARGHSVEFGREAMMYMNQQTFIYLVGNTNNADLYGRRTQGLGTFNNLKDINSLYTGDNLPAITIYDKGYLDEFGNFRLFIPDNVVIVCGKRPAGQKVGDICMTRNANRPDMSPGPWMAVIDRLEQSGQPPREFNVYDSANFGPRIYFPSAIVRMSV